MITISYFKRFSLLAVSILVISCKTDTKTTTEREITPIVTTTSASENALSNTNAIEYTSKQTKADKRKYFDSNNNVVYEVKSKPDGFKLRTPSSDLLWKIKFYESKIKLSDNEDNENAYEIKIVNSYEAKLVRGDMKIARTTYNLNSQIQTVKYEDKSRSSLSKKMEYAPYTLLVKGIREIPNDQQQIIISELKAKGY